jgi:hypothetical protein
MADPGRYDITIHQGATFVLPVQYKDSTGTPVNMSGHTVSGTLWNNNGTSKLANFTTAWQVQASGYFNLQLSASGTSIVAQQGQYDVLVTEPSGDKYYLLEGTAFFNPGLSWRG